MFSRYRVKPSKSQSTLGMVVGIIFVFIGIGQVPKFGFFGVIWTLIALGISVFHGVNVFSNKGVSTYQVDVQSDRSSHESNSDDYESKLRQLYRLKEDGIISDEEYNMKKEEILNSKW